MTATLLFLKSYWRYIAGALFIATLYLWHHHAETVAHDAAVKEGEASVQALWDEEKRQSLVLTEIRRDEVFSLDKLSVGVSSTADANIQKASENENKNLRDALDVLRNRVRVAENKTSDRTEGGIHMPDPGAASFPLDEAISICISPAGGEDLIRGGSSANEVADVLRELQAIAIKDREICNGK